MGINGGSIDVGGVPTIIGQTTVAGSTPIGGTAIVRRTSNSSAKTNNTLANDDTLKLSVAANEVWFFEGYLLPNGANTTMDMQIGWSVPASTTMLWGAQSSMQVAAFSEFSTGNTPFATLTESGALAFATTNVAFAAAIAGVIVVSSTAGTVNMQWAQNTTDAGNLVLNANSWIRFTRLA